MPLLTQNDLQYPYSWEVVPPDDPSARLLDQLFLNRHEGYEVLYYLNELARTSNWTDKAPALKAERLIRERLPGNIRSRTAVTQWLIDNWETPI